jgi:hypothetical protein
VPTRADDASVDGLLKVDAVFTQVKRTVNPGLHLLGAFLFAVGTESKRIAADAEAAIAECLGGRDKVLGTPEQPVRIRYAEGAAQDCWRMGKLPHELEEQLPAAQKARFAHCAHQGRTAAGIAPKEPNVCLAPQSAWPPTTRCLPAWCCAESRRTASRSRPG